MSDRENNPNYPFRDDTWDEPSTDTQWLLDLVEKATPGLWRASQDSANAGREPCGAVIAGSNAVVCVGGGKHNPDMRLIALAPDLARLVCLAAAPDKWDEFLARLAELKP